MGNRDYQKKKRGKLKSLASNLSEKRSRRTTVKRDELKQLK